MVSTSVWFHKASGLPNRSSSGIVASAAAIYCPRGGGAHVAAGDEALLVEGAERHRDHAAEIDRQRHGDGAEGGGVDADQLRHQDEDDAEEAEDDAGPLPGGDPLAEESGGKKRRHHGLETGHDAGDARRHAVPDRPPDTGKVDRVQQHARHHRVADLAPALRPGRAHGEGDEGDDGRGEREAQEQEPERVGERRCKAGDDPAGRPGEDEDEGSDLGEDGHGPAGGGRRIGDGRGADPRCGPAKTQQMAWHCWCHGGKAMKNNR
jgi:hypothetical protein